MDGGRIVEDGSPQNLSRTSGSRYRELLDAAASVSECVWSDLAWRTMRFEEGRLRDAAAIDRALVVSC
jgi:hypothetical protein